MAYATQITIVTGRKGSRTTKSFVLGNECMTHRQTVREILAQPVLSKLEQDGVDGGIELDGLQLTLRLRHAAAEIGLVSDEGLRLALADFRASWLAAEDRDDAFAFAELV